MLTIARLSKYPIWHVESDDRWELAMTFLRIEEYYESPNPNFQGKVFSLEAYMDWYVREYRVVLQKQPYGAFTYASDWSAFNVPGNAVRDVAVKFSDHSAKEKHLFEVLEQDGAFAHARFYLIGSLVGEKDYFEHEYRHAIFTLNEEYRKEVTAIIDRYTLIGLRKWILARYAPTSLIDEIQAYALTGWPKEMLVTAEMESLKKELQQIGRRYISAL